MNESLEEIEKKLDEEISVLKRLLEDQKFRDRLSSNRCVVCNRRGCDIISFAHQKPAHSDCINHPS